MGNMRKIRPAVKLPVWIKLLLAFLLLLLAVSVFCVTAVNVQHSLAQQSGTLPGFGPYQYCSVPEDLEDYPEGSLLLLRRADAYSAGDQVIALSDEETDPSLIFNGRYRLLRISSIEGAEVSASYIGHEGATAQFPLSDIVGRVAYRITALGTVYNWLLGTVGFLLLLVPLVLTIIVIAVMVNMSANRQAAPERYGAFPEEAVPESKQGKKQNRHITESAPIPPPEAATDIPQSVEVPQAEAPAVKRAEPAIPTEQKLSRRERRRLKREQAAQAKNAEHFDLFEENLSPEETTAQQPDTGPALAFTAEAESFAAAQESPKVSPLMDPVGRRLAQFAADSGRCFDETTPAEPMPVEQAADGPNLENMLSGPSVPAEQEELPLPYRPEEWEEPVPVPDEAVAIYDEDTPAPGNFAPPYLDRGTERSLEELRASLREERRKNVVDIVLEEQAAALSEEERARLDKISALDPDRVIAEIKRRNALYEQSIRREPADERSPVEPPLSASADELLQKYRQDTGTHREGTVHISVRDTEEAGPEPSPFHNRNVAEGE